MLFNHPAAMITTLCNSAYDKGRAAEVSTHNVLRAHSHRYMWDVSSDWELPGARDHDFESYREISLTIVTFQSVLKSLSLSLTYVTLRELGATAQLMSWAT
jgi:hypothetical protein